MLEWPPDHLYKNYYRLLTLIRGIKSIGDCSPFSPELANAVETRLVKIESLQRDYPEPKMPSVAAKMVSDSESSSSHGDDESESENEEDEDESQSDDEDHPLVINELSSPLPPTRRKCCCCCCCCWLISLIVSLIVGGLCLHSICVGVIPPPFSEYSPAKQLLALQPHIPEPVCMELRDIPDRLQRIVENRRNHNG